MPEVHSITLRRLMVVAVAMVDELVLEEKSMRAMQRKMDDAFCAAMQRAINAGEENTPTVVSKKPGTKKPKIVFA
jgi:hypothetical protein